MNRYLRKIWLPVCSLAVLAVLAWSCSGKTGTAVNSVADVRKATIGVQLGTTNDVQASLLEEKGYGAHVERFTKSADAVQALCQGKIDCMIEDEYPAKAFQRRNPVLSILPEVFSTSDVAICVAKDNEPLLQKINQAIGQLRTEGILDSIMTRHVEGRTTVAYTPRQNTQDKAGRRTLRFAVNAAFEPFEYYEDGKIVGIDVDVARAICDRLDMNFEMVDMEFDAIITSVQAGKADAGISAITMTEERSKNISFSVPYATMKQVVIVRSDGATAISQGLAEKFRTCFIDGNRYQYLFRGLGNTLVITLFAMVLSLVLGTLIAIVRATHDRNGTHRVLNFLCQVYLTVIRGTPSMVQLLIIYYVVFASADVNKIVVAITAFGLNSAAYIAEVIRSGIMSVNHGQMEAGRSLGLSYSQTMRLVVLPQAFRNVLPAIGNELITLLKETSISGYIGLVDLTKGSDIIRSVTYDAMMPLGMVAAIYLVIVLALSAGVAQLEKRLKKKG